MRTTLGVHGTEFTYLTGVQYPVCVTAVTRCARLALAFPIPGAQELLVIRSDTAPAGTRRGRPARSAARGLGVAGILLAPVALAAPASAHVTATPSTTEAGASTIVTVSIGHGCEGSSTTAVQIRIPESVYSVTPTRNPLWDVAV